MRKFLALIFIVNLGFGAEFSLPEATFEILSVQNGSAQIANSENFVIGSGGVVTREFKDGLKTIIAKAVVVAKNGEFAKVIFEPFDDLNQRAIPSLNSTPAKGDKIMLNYLYDRVILIAPNEQIYKQTLAAFKNIAFIHPDIVAAYLSKEYRPNPSKDDFKVICAQNAAGLAAFVLKNQIIFADCSNFKIIKKISQKAEFNDASRPFWSHVEVKSIFWKIGSSQIDNYEKYYENLLK